MFSLQNLARKGLSKWVRTAEASAPRGKAVWYDTTQDPHHIIIKIPLKR